MKSLFIGILLLEVVSGLTLFEAFLRVISGQPLVRELRDFPRCGRLATPGQLKETNAYRPTAIGPPREEVEGESERYADNRNHNPSSPFGYDYCSISDKCSFGEGDCDSDDECHPPLRCGYDNCRDFNSSAADDSDCCIFETNLQTASSVADDYSTDGELDISVSKQTGISSPDFPDDYADNWRIAWTVQPRGYNGYVTLNMLYFDVEGSSTCRYDVLRIFRRSRLTSGYTQYEALDSFCGTLPSTTTKSYYIPQGGTLELLFSSDGSVTRDGFLIGLTCGTQRCRINEIWNSTSIAAYTTTPSPTTFPFTPPTPAKEIETKRGEEKTPNYPKNYNNSLDWTETLTTDSEKRIWVIFEDFCLEGIPGTDPTNCPYDWVNITETSSGRTLLEKHCGCVKPNVSRSMTNSVTVHFHSDNSDTDRGFKFSWYEAASDVDELNIMATTTTTTTTTTTAHADGTITTNVTNTNGNITITAPANGTTITIPGEGTITIATQQLGTTITAANGITTPDRPGILSITVPEIGTNVTALGDGTITITASENGTTLAANSPTAAQAHAQIGTITIKVAANRKTISIPGDGKIGITAVASGTQTTSGDAATVGDTARPGDANGITIEAQTADTNIRGPVDGVTTITVPATETTITAWTTVAATGTTGTEQGQVANIHCAGTVTDMSCCNSNHTCGYGQGDCDVDDDCTGDLE